MDPQELKPREAAEEKNDLTVPERAVAAALERAVELIWDGERAYIVVGESGHVRTYAVESRAFRRWLISTMQVDRKRPPANSQQWGTVREHLEAGAERCGIKPTPSIRVAGRDGAIYIDLGDDGWKCVEVTTGGWKVVPHPADGPYFYRPPRMAGLPEPQGDGRLDRIYHFLNAHGDDERKLLLAYLVQSLWPRGPYPIATVHGPHGSTKTTRVSVLKALTDPTLSSEEISAVTSPRKPPRDERSIIAAARNNRVVAFDNVSYLDQWLSDALCRLATGAELGDRGLYTDFDEAIFAASRPVIINGIPDVVGQSDLADRCIQTDAHAPAKRVPESVFWAEFKAEWPNLLGSVLDLLSSALRNWGEAGNRVNQDVRMGNFARIGEAIGIELGWAAASFTAAYAENLRNAATEISQMDPIFEPLNAVLADHGGQWTGTMSELKVLLEAALFRVDAGQAERIIRDKRNWPQNAKAVGSKLMRLAPALKHDCISVGETVRSNGRAVRTISLSARSEENVH
jgi:putative DNA primase/helicase